MEVSQAPIDPLVAVLLEVSCFRLHAWQENRLEWSGPGRGRERDGGEGEAGEIRPAAAATQKRVSFMHQLASLHIFGLSPLNIHAITHDFFWYNI